MNISVQTDDFHLLGEAVNSECNDVRFGSEFCMYKMPNLELLEKAYETVENSKKSFTYVTPRLSNDALESLRKQLVFLDDMKDVRIIVNDLGAINALKDYQHLLPHLGRQMIRVPAQSPWTEKIIKGGLREGGRLTSEGRSEIYTKGDLSVIEWYKNAFSETGLNHRLLMLLRSFGVRGADVNWIPRTFRNLDALTKHGFNLAVHLHLVPISVTRRCHTARFTEEKSPEECSRPCLRQAFLLKNDLMGLELILNGNVVFTHIPPHQEEIQELRKIDVPEIVLTMNPVTCVDDRQKIDEFIKFASSSAKKDRFGFMRILDSRHRR